MRDSLMTRSHQGLKLSFRMVLPPVMLSGWIFTKLKESVMGRGDKRSRKGKIFKGSYGNVRPHKVAVYIAPAATAVKAAPKTLSVKKK